MPASRRGHVGERRLAADRLDCLSRDAERHPTTKAESSVRATPPVTTPTMRTEPRTGLRSLTTERPRRSMRTTLGAAGRQDLRTYVRPMFRMRFRAALRTTHRDSVILSLRISVRTTPIATTKDGTPTCWTRLSLVKVPTDPGLSSRIVPQATNTMTAPTAWPRMLGRIFSHYDGV